MTEQGVAVPAEKPKKTRRTPEQVIAELREEAETREKYLKARALEELRRAIEECQSFAAKYPSSQAAKTVTQAIALLTQATQQPF